MKRFITALLFCAFFATPSLASAKESRSHLDREWYGWQTIVTDAASTALVLVALQADDGGLRTAAAWSSLGIYALGGPIVHLAHGRPAASGASLGLRLGAPLVLGAAGLGAGLLLGGKPDREWGLIGPALYGASIGLGAGVFTAVALDAAVFGYEEKPAQPASGMRVVPQLAVTPSGAHVGLGGTF